MTQHSAIFTAFADLNCSFVMENVLSPDTHSTATSHCPSLSTALPTSWSMTHHPHTQHMAPLPNRLTVSLATQVYPQTTATDHKPYRPDSGLIYHLPAASSPYGYQGFASCQRRQPEVSNMPQSVHSAISDSTKVGWTDPQRDMQASNHTYNPLGWPALEDQYIEANSHWSNTTSPPRSPEMRFYTPVPGYTFPHSSDQSSQAPHDISRQFSPASSASNTSPSTSRRSSVDLISSTIKVCSHCRTTSTPLWRREPGTLKPLCNACGLYLQQRNKHRPQELIDADAAEDLSESDGDGSGPECSHCHTHHTSVWRRSKTGAQLCNACGVYSRLRGRDRPLSLKRNRIKPRTKHTGPK